MAHTVHDSAIDINGPSGPVRIASAQDPDIPLDELSILSSSAPDASTHASLDSLGRLGLNRSFSHGAPSRVSIHSLPTEILQDALSHLIPHVPASKPTEPPTDIAASGQSPEDPDPATTPNLDPSPYPSASEIRLRNLLNASRVNKAFHETAKRLLWEDVQVTGGRGWMSVVDALVEEVDATDDEMGESVDWGAVREAGKAGFPGAPARSPMSIAMPRSPFGDMHGTGEHLPLPVGELAFSVASPISPTGSVISRESYMVNSHYSPRPPCAETPLSPPIASNSLPPIDTTRPADVEIMRSAPPRTVSLLTPAQSRLSSPSPARRRLQSRSRSQSKPRLPVIPANAELGAAYRSRSPSSGASGAGQGSATASPATATPPTRSRLSSLSRAASYRGRPNEGDEHQRRGIDAVLAEDERSRSVSFGKLERPATIAPPPGAAAPQDVEMMYDENAIADGEEEEEDRGRSGWSRTSGSTTQSVAEKLFARPSNSSSSRSRTRGTRTWSFATNLETEDVVSLEAKHRLEDWEVSSFQWEAPEQTITPGQWIRHLSFANFRTTGTRRTQEEAIRGKFVTGGRLEGVLKNAPNLRTLAMTEYVDSSLTLPVLTELFFRGCARPTHEFIQEAMPRDADGALIKHAMEYVPYEPETDEEEWGRRSGFVPLDALDLTACVSKVFTESLEAFVKGWLAAPAEDYPMSGDEEDDRRGRSRAVRALSPPVSRRRLTTESDDSDAPQETGWTKPRFDRLKRLSLRACTTISSETMCTLVSSFPRLTYLDLSVTRVSSALLEALGQISSLRLNAFSIARCTRVSSEAIRDFLIHAPGAATITDLNLFGDFTYTSPLTEADLEAIVRYAPCFKSKQLRYLDISSAPVTTHLLREVLHAQPKLRSLGLSYIPSLELEAVADFLRDKAPNVEILALVSSAALTDFLPNLTALATTMILHTTIINPLTLPPFSLFAPPGGSSAPTKLRVIELNTRVRNLLGATGGSKDWRTIKSKGNRGWYVDTSSGWVEEPAGSGVRTFKRRLPPSHPNRQYLEHLAEYNGRVASNVGWHARKMEVIRGDGMLGREGGLYGADAFAFEG